jgi:hypothetical protein
MFHICQNESRGLLFVPDLFILQFPLASRLDLGHVAGNAAGNHAALQTFEGFRTEACATPPILRDRMKSSVFPLRFRIPVRFFAVEPRAMASCACACLHTYS